MNRSRRSRSSSRGRVAALLITLLVGSCSLPTFNPPKLKSLVGPGGPPEAVMLLERAGR